VTPKIGQVRFVEATEDVLNDYRINNKRSLDDVERRIEKHLKPFFVNRRLSSITTSDVRAYVVARQGCRTITVKPFQFTARDGSVRNVPAQKRSVTGVSNAEINRELTTLKRVFNLALQAGKLVLKPYIPMLRENNVRTGFFDRDDFEAVVRRLPNEIQPIVAFAYITGWRIDSEVLPLQWKHVDFGSGEVRLEEVIVETRPVDPEWFGEGRVELLDVPAEVLAVLEVELVLAALLRGTRDDVPRRGRVAEDRRAELLVHEDSRSRLRHAPGDRRLEALIDDAFGIRDLGGLFGRQGAVPAEHLRLERAAVIEREDVGRSVESQFHRLLSSGV
jgi:hypothetical protein